MLFHQTMNSKTFQGAKNKFPTYNHVKEFLN